MKLLLVFAKYFLIIFIIVSIILLVHKVSAHNIDKVPHYRYKNITEAIIYNPTPFGAKLLVKCDWDGKIWRSVKTYPLKGKTEVSIRVPNGSRCKVYPSLK